MSEIRYLRSVHTCRIETFSAFTRVQKSRCIIRSIFAMCRRNTQNAFCFIRVASLQTIFHFSFLFFDICWLDDKVRVLFGKFSYSLQNTALDGMVWLGIGLVGACEIAFKIDEAMLKTFKSDCAVTGQEKSEPNFLKLAERRKKPVSSRKKPVSSRKKPQSASRACAFDMETHPDIRMPRLHVSKEHRDIRMIHLWNRFRTAPDSVSYCSG